MISHRILSTMENREWNKPRGRSPSNDHQGNIPQFLQDFNMKFVVILVVNSLRLDRNMDIYFQSVMCMCIMIYTANVIVI